MRLANKFLVNEEKVKRAQGIVELLGRPYRNEDEREVKEKFSKLLADAKVDPEDALLFVYEKLGGLVRTEAEEKAHEAKVAEIKAKKKK